MRKVFRYIRDVRRECFLITWAKREDVMRGIILVIVFSVIFATFLFLIDSIMSAIVKLIF